MNRFRENFRIKRKNIKIIVEAITIVLLSMLLLNNHFVVKAIEEMNNTEETKESKLISNQEIEKYLELENGQTLLQEKISVEIENFKTKEYEIIKEKAPNIQTALCVGAQNHAENCPD